MAVSPSTENYMYSKGSIFFRPEGENGYLHLGNCPAFSLNVELEKAEHFSSMSGIKEKDFSKVIQKSAKGSITMEELSAENLNLVMMGGGVIKSEVSAQSAVSATIAVKIGKFIPISEAKSRLESCVATKVNGGEDLIEGVDYLLNREAGLFLALPDRNLSDDDEVQLMISTVKVTKKSIRALAESSCSGELFFVGSPDLGPKWQVKGWKVELSLSGELAFISDDIAQVTVEAEFQADRLGHPDCPFFEAVCIE